MTTSMLILFILALAEVEYDTHLDEPSSIRKYLLIVLATEMTKLWNHMVVDVGSGTSLSVDKLVGAMSVHVPSRLG